jgi:hypothetical protein
VAPTGDPSLRRSLASAVALAALAGAAALPSEAAAAGYQVEACRSADGNPLPSTAWRFSSTGRAGGRGFQRRYDLCSNGTGIGMVLPARGLTRRDAVRLTFRVPSGTRATGVTLTRRFAVAGQVAYRLLAVRRGRRPRVLESCVGSRCQARFGAERRISNPLPPRVSRIVLELRCPRRRCATLRGSAGSAAVFIQRAVVDLSDNVRPRLTNGRASGQLFSGAQGQGGVRTFVFNARDTGGGLREATLHVDGNPVATFEVGGGANVCRRPYITPRPCVTRARRTFPLDTAQFGNGPHELRLVVTDAGGLTYTTAPTLASFYNATRSEPFAVISAGISLAQTGAARARLIVPFGRGAFVRGRLLQASGNPAGGAPVRGLTRIFGFSGEASVANVVTDPNGYFGFFVPPGPARTVRVVHETPSGYRAAEARATFDVRARVDLRANPRRVGRGGITRLSGRVRNAGAGLLVELQARRGSRYQTFATARTGSGGRFAYRYRFGGRGRFALRARVPQQNGLAYSTGASTPRRVVVG